MFTREKQTPPCQWSRLTTLTHPICIADSLSPFTSLKMQGLILAQQSLSVTVKIKHNDVGGSALNCEVLYQGKMASLSD